MTATAAPCTTTLPAATRSAEELADPVASAHAAGLRYVSDDAPGIRRRRAGKGFSYTGTDGKAIRDERTLAREGTPSAQMRKAELSEVIREALDVLGEDQKMAVLLNKFEDMSYAEIAEVMGRSESAVKSLLARARNQLREQLEPYLRTGQRGP